MGVLELSAAISQARVHSVVAGIEVPVYRRLAASGHYTPQEVEDIIASMRCFAPWFDVSERLEQKLTEWIPKAPLNVSAAMNMVRYGRGELSPQTFLNSILVRICDFMLGAPHDPIPATQVTIERLEHALEHVWKPFISMAIRVFRAACDVRFWSPHTSLVSIISVFHGFSAGAPLLEAILRHIHQLPFDRSAECQFPTVDELISGEADPDTLAEQLGLLRSADKKRIQTLSSCARDRMRKVYAAMPDEPPKSQAPEPSLFPPVESIPFGKSEFVQFELCFK